MRRRPFPRLKFGGATKNAKGGARRFEFSVVKITHLAGFRSQTEPRLGQARVVNCLGFLFRERVCVGTSTFRSNNLKHSECIAVVYRPVRIKGTQKEFRPSQISLIMQLSHHPAARMRHFIFFSLKAVSCTKSQLRIIQRRPSSIS